MVRGLSMPTGMYYRRSHNAAAPRPAQRREGWVPIPDFSVCAAQYSYRKENDGFHQLQHAIHGDAHNPEGQQNQPHQRIKNQGDQGQRPAHHEKNAPQNKSQHTWASRKLYVYAGGKVAVRLAIFKKPRQTFAPRRHGATEKSKNKWFFFGSPEFRSLQQEFRYFYTISPSGR